MFAEPRFRADADHPGTSEASWAASRVLTDLPALVVAAHPHVLVVAPHPDDEVLGAGGLLQVLGEGGATIEICAVTDGEASHRGLDDAGRAALRATRTGESQAAGERLGLSAARRTRLRHPDGQVNAHREQLVDFLAGRLGPDSLCLAPWRSDGHPDHDAAGQAAALAAAQRGATLLEYLVWTWHWAAPPDVATRGDAPWASARRLELDRRRAARKRWATLAFRSQIRPTAAQAAGPAVAAAAVLPPGVLRRFWRPYEVFVT